MHYIKTYCLCLVTILSTLISNVYGDLDLRIPVVDMNDFYAPEKREEFLNTLYDAMSTVGFFAVRNTGVDREVISQAYDQAKIFFQRDLDYKKQFMHSDPRGYMTNETAKGNNMKDHKEIFHMGRENSPLPNVWPDQEGYREAMVPLFNELDKYVIPLQEAIIATINLHGNSDLPLDFLGRETFDGFSLLRSLYYPAMDKEMLEDLEKPLFWAAPHTDIDLMTLLPFATEKGLQLEMDGQWLNVVVPEDAFIVNVGDMLQNLTNGLFKSAKHRVLAAEPNKERYSMVFFVHPRAETKLDPLPDCIQLTGGEQKYAAGTRLEFLWERLLEVGTAPEVLELYSKTGHTERQMVFGRESPQVVKLLIDNDLASPELLQMLKDKSDDYYARTRDPVCN